MFRRSRSSGAYIMLLSCLAQGQMVGFRERFDSMMARNFMITEKSQLFNEESVQQGVNWLVSSLSKQVLYWCL
jgi:hypothetical protein